MAAKQGHRGREGRGSEQKGGSARDGECCGRLREEADAQRGPGGGRRGAGGFPGEGQCKAFAQMAQGSRGHQRGVCGALSGGRAVRCGYGGQGTGSRLSVLCGGGSHAVRVGPCFPSSHMVGGSVSGVSGFCSDGVGLVSPVLRSVSLFVGFILSDLILSCDD